MTLTVGSLCSGYEATGLGLALAGGPHRLAFVAENDPAASAVLAHHHPDVPNLGDITTINWADVEDVDLTHAGFPCTDVSAAGKQNGLAEDIVIPAGVMPCGCQWADHQILDCVAQDQWGGSPAWNCEQGLIDQAATSVDWLNEQDREDDGPPPERVVKGTRSGVWAHVRRHIDEHRPPLVLIENVPGLLSTWANRSTDAPTGDVESGTANVGDGPDRPVLRALGAVLGDLADLRFDAVWVCVSAAEVGAPHLRKRIFILAWDTEAEDRVQEILNRITGPVRGDAVGPDGLTLLPTPAARLGDGRGTPNPETAARRMGEEGRRNLDDAIALLPTPTATPYGNNQSPSAGAAVRPSLNSLAANALLPTPTAMHTARNATANRTNPKPTTTTTSWTLADIAYADRWGEYAPAIARWEAVFGRPAPDPTEPGKNGQPRLAARFVEWLQGLPDGYVTAVPGITRNDALRLLGNANPPQQYAAAITQLAALVAHITAKELAA